MFFVSHAHGLGVADPANSQYVTQFHSSTSMPLPPDNLNGARQSSSISPAFDVVPCGCSGPIVPAALPEN